ncbi:hypothetical protein [Salipiger abyssi]|uniref:hypothetical protein n=1 Tax=Salipiger abyssi TaxID=1250539 RepID=UPI001A8F3F18|nr:hypothetical protein [Salipiger abyssi]MBN9890144.1 hypothetical protein [Salipiger abyssi]
MQYLNPSDTLQISVPFEKLQRERVVDLNSGRAQSFLANVLISSAHFSDASTLRQMVHVLKRSRKHPVTLRSMVYCKLSSEEMGVSEYFSARQSFEKLTSIGPNESINSIFVAFWLHRATNRDLYQYITGGLLSEAASDVILKFAGAEKGEYNTPLLREREFEAGRSMASEKLRQASLRAFGFVPDVQVELSDEQLAAHKRRMADYREQRPNRTVSNKSLLETIESFKASILSR